ncbi:MAG: zinc-binding dehydrogenase [Chloroflexi bacterium]|nr:zinc-binding dehydrogenase [Chloroflexota bacterium]
MKSLQMLGDRQVALIDVPIPQPGPQEVVVRTAVSVICGSEMHTYRHDGSPKGNPGHESAGWVAQLGEGVEGLQVGQRVGVHALSGCGTCADCRAGRFTWCAQHAVYGSSHAEYALTKAHSCIPLPDDVSWEVGVLLAGDGIGVPYHTSRRLQAPEIRSVAIFGAGPIGLGNVMMQSYLGRQVIVVEPSADRCALARELGAAEAIDSSDGDAPAHLRELTDGAGPDVCIEAAGKPITFKQALQAVRTGGVVAVNGEQGPLSLSPSEDLIRRDITVFGSWFCFTSEFSEMLALYRQGFPADRLITHRYPIAQAAEAYAAFDAQATGKVLLSFVQDLN